uniref:Uncharacterized protein n=1 Tax=Anguilla anguilla TaxID=7936 RepID=A0A0E9Q4N3_ANGAN
MLHNKTLWLVDCTYNLCASGLAIFVEPQNAQYACQTNRKLLTYTQILKTIMCLPAIFKRVHLQTF